MKIFLAFSVFLSFSLTNINATLIEPKLESRNWMDERIQKDLENILPSSVKAHDIDHLLFFSHIQKTDGVSYLILKISIFNNIPSFMADSEETMNFPRTLIIKNFFCKLCQRFKLPNIELIFSLHDAFDLMPDESSDVHDLLKIPVFVFAKNKKSINRVLFPDFEALNNDQLIIECQKAAKKHPWNRKIEKVFFRGSSTNKYVTINNVLENPRFKIVDLSQKMPNLIDAAFTYIYDFYKSYPPSICVISPLVSMQDHFNYKYLIDIDGNSCSYSRCRWIILSNSILLKCESDNIQWYYDLLKPYENYIPVNGDLSNIELQVDWLKNHDRLAKQISLNATKLGRMVFNSKAIEEYVVKLLWHYNACFDSNSMND